MEVAVADDSANMCQFKTNDTGSKFIVYYVKVNKLENIMIISCTKYNDNLLYKMQSIKLAQLTLARSATL